MIWRAAVLQKLISPWFAKRDEITVDPSEIQARQYVA
jgi:hypothetical protein